jgi:hypothetical protein
MTILRQAILDGFKKAGWLSPTEDVVRQIEYSVNQMEDRAANEGLKKERRDMAYLKLKDFLIGGRGSDFKEELLAIIAEAQG